MADYLPKFDPGAAVTFTAEADVTGGRLVIVTGDRTVSPASADSGAIAGVAARDTKAGEHVTVFGPQVHRLVAAGAIAAGARIVSAADGKVAAAGEEAANVIGVAYTGSDSADAVIEARIF